ncbi:MAG: hypothetical protein WED85_11400 [Dehalococcoidia bacterium]
MRRLLPLPFIFALLAVTSFTPRTALACFPETGYNALLDSDLVVIGEVTGERPGPDGSTIWDFGIRRAIKGTSPETLELTYSGRSDCESQLINGRSYVLAFDSAFTHRSPPSFNTFPAGGGASDDRTAEAWLADHAEEKDTPWAVVLPLALIIPLATLLVPAFLRRRSAGH